MELGDTSLAPRPKEEGTKSNNLTSLFVSTFTTQPFHLQSFTSHHHRLLAVAGSLPIDQHINYLEYSSYSTSLSDPLIYRTANLNTEY
jgi:hypothetical protein